MKIGIGITTAGVRDIRADAFLSDPMFKSDRDVFCVYTDYDKQGVAHAKNGTMQQLYTAGCTHMFLFDDDCYPMMPGWIGYVIENARKHNLQYIGLPESFKSRLVRHVEDEMTLWDGMLGCFLFQTREAMEKVGYYNAAYHRYGYEDAGRAERLRRAFGYRVGQQPSLLRLPSYIYSEDVYARNPTPNMSHAEKMACIEKNRNEWTREVNSEQLYYPYG